MSTLWLVIQTLGSLLSSACMLRALAHRVHLSPRNPIHQFIVAVTDWLVLPLRKLMPASRGNDWASLLAALLVAVITALLYYLILGVTPAPGAVLLVGIGYLIKWSFHLLIAILILQAVLSWVNPDAPIAPALNQMTAPFLQPLRRLIPPIGGVDLSPLVLILVVYVALDLLQNLLFRMAAIAS